MDSPSKDDDAPPSIVGGCACGAVRFEVRSPVLWAGHCWCVDCRRAISAGVASFLGVARDATTWRGVEPTRWTSSPNVERWFCGRCGSHVAYLSDRWPDEIHLYAATLDDQTRYAPEFHVHTAEAPAWLTPGDALPRHRRGI